MSKDFNSPKFLSKQLKLAGLQKLKFYCQICEKQCRDDNGFKSHIRSETHINKIQSLSYKDIEDFSNQFKSQFLSTLKTSHKTYINANRFYNELISNKQHIHLNSTKWHSLSQFIKDMNSKGLINIKKGDDEQDDSMNNLDIIYNGNLDKLQKDEDNEKDMTLKLIEKQIQKGIKLKKEVHLETPTEIKPVKFQLKSNKISKPLKTPLKNNPLKSVKKNPLKQ